jgi:hypothetical protein
VNDFHLDIITVLSANVGQDDFEGGAEKIGALLASIVETLVPSAVTFPFSSL